MAATPQLRAPGSSSFPFGLAYRTAVVVIAVLVVGLPWCRTGRSGFLAQGLVTISTDSDQVEAHAHLQPVVEQIVQVATSEKRLLHHLTHERSLKNELGRASNEAAVEILQRRLEVTPERVGGRVTVNLRFAGASHEACRRMIELVLDDMQTQFADWKQEKENGIRQVYEEPLAKAAAELAEIENRLRDEFRTQEEAPAFRPPPQEANPEWKALADETAAAKARLRGMLETRTPQHPQAAELIEKVEALESRLAATPRHLAPSAETEALVQKASLEAQQRQERIARLEKQRGEAHARWQALHQHEADAEKALAFLNGVHFQTPAHRSQVMSVGGVWKPTAVLLLLGWSIFGGLIAYQLAWSAAQPQVLATVGQLAAVAPIPVVGAVAISSAPATTRPLAWPSRECTWVLVRGAELALLGVFLMMVLALQSQPGFATLWWADPVGGMQEAWSLVTGLRF